MVLEGVLEGMGTADASAAETGELASTQKQRLETELENPTPSSALPWIFWRNYTRKRSTVT